MMTDFLILSPHVFQVEQTTLELPVLANTSWRVEKYDRDGKPPSFHDHDFSVLVIDLAEPFEQDFAFIETITLRHPSLLVFLVCNDISIEMLKAAMRAGVRNILPSPINTALLERLVQDIGRIQSAKTLQRQRTNAVLTFMPSKGGVGNTFLASNLAYALSEREKKVLLIDLNLSFGDAIYFLSDTYPPTSIMDVSKQSHRLDSTLLDSSVTKIGPLLHLLPAPLLPYQLDSLVIDNIMSILLLACENYDFVLIDIPKEIDLTSLAALEAAHIIYLVVRPTLLSVQGAKRVLDTIADCGKCKEKVELVLNASGKNNVLNEQEISQITQIKISHTIKESTPSVENAITQGMPIQKLSPRDTVSVGLAEWADTLIQTPHASQTANGASKAPAWLSWWKK